MLIDARFAPAGEKLATLPPTGPPALLELLEHDGPVSQERMLESICYSYAMLMVSRSHRSEMWNRR